MEITFEKAYKILKLIKKYAKIHPSASVCGSEYINQDDDAQFGAIELVCDIFDVISKESESEEK